jgi:hypothetical protein
MAAFSSNVAIQVIWVGGTAMAIRLKVRIRAIREGSQPEPAAGEGER